MTDKLVALLTGHLKVQHNWDYVYQYQIEIARTILDALVQNLRITANATEEDIKHLKHIERGFEISRQAGKTSIIVATLEFIGIYVSVLFGRPIHIGIFAPQREQAKTDFDRLKQMLRKDTEFTETASKDLIDVAREESNSKTIVLPNGSSFYVFPVTSTSRPESKTLDLSIFEESQDLDDNIVSQQIEPMTAATNGPHIFVGTAGTRICKFYRMGQSGKTTKLYFPDVAPQRREAYNQTANAQHLIYEQTVKQRIEEHGIESDEIQRPYFGKWLIGSGQFVTQEDLEAIESDRDPTYHDKQHECFAGIDTAKNPDSTVLTILRWNSEIKKKEVLNWCELRGDNYKDQFDILLDFLGKYNVVAVAIDSTGQGDFMPDMFERDTQWSSEGTGLYRVKFSAVSKDQMYKNLKVSIKEFLTTLPKLRTRNGERFKQQMLDLQQEYKGQLLSVHHPDDPNAHDDYPDSWALAEWAFAKWQEGNKVSISTVNFEPEKKVTKRGGEIIEHWPGEFE